jgi:hypothetical protein
MPEKAGGINCLSVFMFIKYFSKKLNSPTLNRISVYLFFICLFFAGFIIYPDYGISIDEPQTRNIGRKSLDFLVAIFNNPPENLNQLSTRSENWFSQFTDRDYGVAFLMPLEALIYLIGPSDSRAYIFRHAFVFLFYFLGVIALYQTAKWRYRSIKMGLLAALIFTLSPRLFGESFFNDRDIVFMTSCAIATFTLIGFLLRNKPFFWICIHSLASAISVDIRIMGIIFPLATIAILLIQYFKKSISIKILAYKLLGYLIITTSLIVLFWPWLWGHPIENLLSALTNMSKFRHIVPMNFMGHIVNGDNLPWYYIPVWISVTTPALYSALFIFGAVAIITRLAQANWQIYRNCDELQDLIFLGFFISPIASVVLLNSVLYNGWRHLYFVYPSFVLIAVGGFYEINSRTTKIKWANFGLKLITLTSFCLTLSWSIIWHPYQYLYFNGLAGNWNNNFEVDYWGVAYRSPLEKIVNQHPTDSYFVFANVDSWNGWQLPYIWNLFALTEDQRKRIISTKSEACSDYFIADEKKFEQLVATGQFDVLDRLYVDHRIVYGTLKRPIPLEKKYRDPNLKLVEFSNPETRCFLSAGWSNSHEKWGTWSVGKNASITLLRPSNNSKRLILDLRAFVAKGSVQKVEILINGKHRQDAVFDNFDLNTIIIDLPPPTKIDDQILIEFKIPNAVSPKSLKQGDDGRELGIGIIQARFE